MADGHAVDLRDKLCRSRDTQIGLRVPVALDEFVDRLVVAAEDEGERTNRKELIAAILATTAPDGAALGRTLHRYRTMTIGDCLPEIGDGNNVVQVAERKPGPRPR